MLFLQPERYGPQPVGNAYEAATVLDIGCGCAKESATSPALARPRARWSTDAPCQRRLSVYTADQPAPSTENDLADYRCVSAVTGLRLGATLRMRAAMTARRRPGRQLARIAGRPRLPT